MDIKQAITVVMTRDALSVDVSQSVSSVRHLMSEKNLHHVPVVGDGKLIGLISMSDILSISYTEFVEDDSMRDRILDERCTIEDLMVREPVTLSYGATVGDAARVLSQGLFHSVPIVDDEGALVGIVSSTDLIRYLASGG